MKKSKIDIKLDTQTSTKENYCPKCKSGKMTVTITPAVIHLFKQVHIFKSFCPVCGYTIKKVV